ncbi:hypothetical protein H010_23830 [Hydrogenophaga taeniospiralis CCUG 15921]|uniref:Uncharacterized protein n=1 Tax=Hydrogenophaga taeniospiralis CCUG 15921 TaxID=1281780 RepID=A0A9X4SHR7_9BURK|nr:hypothetical protein [Hydrogenophaga taeniospiralis]MDG5978301.1 hypothetical protein [Hydrogenophaga taeniospiralis CCUG 15921]
MRKYGGEAQGDVVISWENEADLLEPVSGRGLASTRWGGSASSFRVWHIGRFSDPANLGLRHPFVWSAELTALPMNTLLLAGTSALVVVFSLVWRRYLAMRREAFIRHAELPKGLFERLQKRHPNLTTKECQLVAHGLRQFFLAHLQSGRKFVSMPSQVVDDLWHEFILYTKNYDAFCRQAFGRFLHHTPAVVLGRAQRGNAGLRRCWWYVCKEENINPRAASRLPLLFALDTKLAIPGGFRYVPDCRSVRREGGDASGGAVYCGGEFSDASIDGSVDGFGDGHGDASSADGSGGSGSDGCGGGGCGGGD